MDQRDSWNISLRTIRMPLIFITLFYSIAFWRYYATENIFYIYNFIYIGTAIALGLFLKGALPGARVFLARRITQLLVGIYMLFYLGFIRFENMQIEGFFFYLFAGVFASATLHYMIAKIAGPLFFGRGWCGWACWTAMVLDFLPWKKPGPRKKRIGIIRYIHFFLSLGLMLFIWFVLKERTLFENPRTALYWLAAGNLLYYSSSILMADLFSDNRAFCKYACPVPVLQKVTSRFSLLKVEIDSNKCIDCRICEENCPSGILLLNYKNEGKRILSTECIQCHTCRDVCPREAIDITVKFDTGFSEKEYLK